MKALKQIGLFIGIVGGIIGILAMYYYTSVAAPEAETTNVTAVKAPDFKPDLGKIAQSESKPDLDITLEQQNREAEQKRIKEEETRKKLQSLNPEIYNSLLIKKMDSVGNKKRSILPKDAANNESSNVSAVDFNRVKTAASPKPVSVVEKKQVVTLDNEDKPKRENKKIVEVEEESLFNISESDKPKRQKDTGGEKETIKSATNPKLKIEDPQGESFPMEAKVMGNQEISTNGVATIKFRTTIETIVNGVKVPKNLIFFGKATMAQTRLNVNLTSLAINGRNIKCDYYMLSAVDMEEGFALQDQNVSQQKSSAVDNIGSTAATAATGGIFGVNTLVREGLNLARIKNNKISVYEGDKVSFVPR